MRGIVVAGAMLVFCLTGCCALPRVPSASRAPTMALPRPDETALGRHFAAAAHAHDRESGFHIITSGADGLVVRIQMVRAAEKTLDLQYFIFRGDQTGRMLTDELARAADRGVRIRIIVDDGDTVSGDEQILALNTHPNVQVRAFNPFDYRGHNRLLRGIDFMAHFSHLDYRMHNKLLVADNAIALIGGRNVGNQYFQLDPESQFADDDVFVGGPIAQDLSATFEDYWDSTLAVPADVLRHPHDARRWGRPAVLKGSGIDYIGRIASGQPYADLIASDTALVWARAQVLCDSPDKKDVQQGGLPGQLMAQSVMARMRTVQSDLIIVTPYFVPTDTEVKLPGDLRRRGVRVRVLSNSLESIPGIVAYSGYSGYRLPLLQEGVQLYEIRALLGKVKGSGETQRVARYGNYALHAKLFVFDQSSVFIGSMNFDQRSYRINTEVGLIIDSPVLAQQTAARFEAMIDPQAAYTLQLRRPDSGTHERLSWQTTIDGAQVEFYREPTRRAWQRDVGRLLALFPINGEL